MISRTTAMRSPSSGIGTAPATGGGGGGPRDGRGRGLVLFVNGRKVAEAAAMGRLTVELPPPEADGTAPARDARLHHFAAHNGGGPLPPEPVDGGGLGQRHGLVRGALRHRAVHRGGETLLPR